MHRDERFHPEHVREKKRFFYRKSIRKTLESPRAIIYYEIYVKLSMLNCIQNNAHWMDALIYLEKFFSISINFWSFSNRKWRHFRETQFFKNTQNQISWYSTSIRPSRKNRIWFLIFRPISWHNWADYLFEIQISWKFDRWGQIQSLVTWEPMVGIIKVIYHRKAIFV